MSTVEQNKETTRRFVESFNEHDREAYVTCCAEHSVLHMADKPPRTLDLDIHWEDSLAFYKNFPDIQATIDNMVAENDRVFLRQTLSGTHAETGKEVTWAYWCEYRFNEDGLIAEMWCLSNSFHLLQQLGKLNPSEPKPAKE